MAKKKETIEIEEVAVVVEEAVAPAQPSIHDTDVKPEYVQVGHETRAFRS
jgi:hypothetical protein